MDERTIMACRRNFLWHKNQPWKKKTNPDFDCPMGSFDSAEVSELTGLYILHKITSSGLGISKEEVGIYRDDGLCVLRKSKRELDNLRKKLHSLFEPLGLKITVETGMKSTDFLDVTLHLESGTFEPYRKEDFPPVYIHKKSNHPHTIKENIPAMIEKRLNSRCSDEPVFNKHKSMYEQALKKSGFNTKLTYNAEPVGPKQRRRPRNPDMFWFNPPFNLGVKTKIGKEFSKILDKCFPKGNKWHEFFNRHTVRLSYSCTRNIASIISAHNQRIIKSQTENTKRDCNCTAEPCPVEGKCLTEGLAYSGTIETKKDNYTYYGSTKNTFKERYNNHKHDLKNESQTGTTLSNKFWKLKKEKPDETPTIKWKIINKCHPLKAGLPICDVCLTEKTRILLQHKGPDPKPATNTVFLNKRNEIFSKCRHRRKFTLSQCENLYSKQIRGQNQPPS